MVPEIIDSYRSVTGAAELLEQLVNADAVGAGKAGAFLIPHKLPLELCQIRHDGIGEGDIYFRLTFEICAQYCTQRNSSRFPRS